MEEISVVVCTREEEDMIGPCLERLVHQRVPSEIIVVDAHSHDRTRDIARKYTDKILLDHGGGLSEARNLGWQACSAPVVAFCDADCHPGKEWTGIILDLMTPGIAGVSGPLRAYDGDSVLQTNIRIWADWFPRVLARGGYHNIWGANMAFQRSILEKYPFRLKFLEDYDLGSRLRKVNGDWLRFDRRMVMEMSSRRFQNSFYRTCLKYYLRAALEIEFFGTHDSEGYYATKSV